MTRKEVEERLEEYAAYKAIKEAHEDVEETPLETNDGSLGNGVDNNPQNFDKEKEEEILAVLPLDEEPQDETNHSLVPSLDNCDLSELDLSDLNFLSISIQNANLTKAILSRVNLSNSSLAKTSLKNAN